MRTTIDLPDELYRTLKTRAAIRGVTLRELVQGFIEQGLSAGGVGSDRPATDRPPLPVAIPATGKPLPLTPDDIHRLEEEEDLERLGRSTGR